MGVRKRKKEERFEGLIEHWNVEKEENREFGSVWCLDLSVLELSLESEGRKEGSVDQDSSWTNV